MGTTGHAIERTTEQRKEHNARLREAAALWAKRAKAGESGAVGELMKAMGPLVRHFARRELRILGVGELEDYAQECSIAVLVALRGWDEGRAPFVPYAIYRIRAQLNWRRRSLSCRFARKVELEGVRDSEEFGFYQAADSLEEEVEQRAVYKWTGEQIQSVAEQMTDKTGRHNGRRTPSRSLQAAVFCLGKDENEAEVARKFGVRKQAMNDSKKRLIKRVRDRAVEAGLM
jgi:DNA-directed RNA polymerase specialized sigma subunit